MSIRINGDSGYAQVPIVNISAPSLTANNYTLVLADKDKVIEINSSSASTVTVDINANVPFSIGSQVTLLATGTGQVTIQPAAGGVATINSASGTKLRTQWSSATLIKRGTDSWVLLGDLTA